MSLYSWCNQVLWSPQMVRKNTSRRWDLRLEVRSPIGGPTSDRRWDLQLEVRSLIGGPTSDQRWDLQLEARSPIGGPPPIGGDTSDWRWDLRLEGPMLHVGISYSFEKKKRLFIVDYIKPSSVYQVKCKLVIIKVNSDRAYYRHKGMCVCVFVFLCLCVCLICLTIVIDKFANNICIVGQVMFILGKLQIYLYTKVIELCWCHKLQ